MMILMLSKILLLVCTLQSNECDGKINAIIEYLRDPKEAVMAYFKLLFQNLRGHIGKRETTVRLTGSPIKNPNFR